MTCLLAVPIPAQKSVFLWWNSYSSWNELHGNVFNHTCSTHSGFLPATVQYGSFSLDIRVKAGSRTDRDTFRQSPERKHLITKQDVANLKRKVCDMAITRRPDDATSVQMMVNELQEEPYDPVLIYKNSSEFPSLPVDAFVLAIQTLWHKELCEKFSQTILCIDSAHNTNAYQFKLITCVVPDDFGKVHCKLFLMHVTKM